MALSNVEKQRRHRAKQHAIERRELSEEQLKQRKKLEKNPIKWLKFFFAEVFPDPWAAVHILIIKSAQRVIKTGKNGATAAPRGMGKSTILERMCLWAVLSGQRKFVVFVAWKLTKSKESFEGWLDELSSNELLLEYYPELVVFWESTNPLRLKDMTWADNGEKCGALVNKSSGRIILPGEMGVLGISSIQTPGRGMKQRISTGAVVRPDLTLVDDPQTTEVADSPDQVDKVIRTIQKDILFLAGHKRRVASLMAVTIIKEDDVAWYFLHNREWDAVFSSLVISWPGDWNENKSKTRALWDEWNEIRVENLDDEYSRKAIKFYKENKKELTDGFEVCWKYGYSKDDHEPDAFFATMWKFYRFGEESFASEMQNEPLKDDSTVFDLSRADILNKTDRDRERFVVPEWCKVLVTATDINHYGLHTMTIGFGEDHTGAIIDYRRFDQGGKGIVQKNENQTDRRRHIYMALVEHGRELEKLKFIRKGKVIAPQMWVIDGGYEHETVQQFVGGDGRKIGLNCSVIRGFSADRYNPAGKGRIGRPLENCHQAESVMGRFIAADVDYWRETFLRMFLGPFGVPGGLTIFAGNHRELATQLLNEKLSEKFEAKDGSYLYKWKTIPGWHDWLDAGVYCCVAAVFGGIGTAPVKIVKRTTRPRRKTKVPIKE